MGGRQLQAVHLSSRVLILDVQYFTLAHAMAWLRCCTLPQCDAHAAQTLANGACSCSVGAVSSRVSRVATCCHQRRLQSPVRPMVGLECCCSTVGWPELRLRDVLHSIAPVHCLQRRKERQQLPSSTEIEAWAMVLGFFLPDLAAVAQ